MAPVLRDVDRREEGRVRVGIDNVQIARMATLGEGFPRRYLSARELAEYEARAPQRRDEYLAGRFAAKEAYIKASGRTGLEYRRIEVLNDPDGAPRLYVDGVRTGQVSLTHDGIATAIVLLEDERK